MLGSREGDVLEDLLQHRVQAARPDVLGARVHVLRDARELLDAGRVEDQLDAFGAQQGRVLAGQRIARLGQDADQVGL